MEERAVAAFGTTGIHFELPAKFIFLDFEITELRFYGAAGPLVDGWLEAFIGFQQDLVEFLFGIHFG